MWLSPLCHIRISNNYRAVLKIVTWAHKWSGVWCSSSTKLTSAPFSTNNVAMRKLPRRQAVKILFFLKRCLLFPENCQLSPKKLVSSGSWILIGKFWQNGTFSLITCFLTYVFDCALDMWSSFWCWFWNWHLYFIKASKHKQGRVQSNC